MHLGGSVFVYATSSPIEGSTSYPRISRMIPRLTACRTQRIILIEFRLD